MGVKYSANESFFDKWSRDMAYVLGYWYADGSLEDASRIRGKYIRVSSVDQEMIRKIKKTLASQHSIIKVPPVWPNGKERALLRIGSHKLYNALVEHGLYPNKSLTVRLPEIPVIYLRDFVRGYFDGDGSVAFVLSEGKTRRRIVRRLRVIFTSGSMIFLEQLSSVLSEKLGLHRVKVYGSKRAFQTMYSTSDSIQLFKSFYRETSNGLYMERKFQIFNDYFSWRPSRVDEEIAEILKKN